MSEHLRKAKQALGAARELDVQPGDQHPPRAYGDLLVQARVQAEIAQAEALTRIAKILAWKFDVPQVISDGEL